MQSNQEQSENPRAQKKNTQNYTYHATKVIQTETNVCKTIILIYKNKCIQKSHAKLSRIKTGVCKEESHHKVQKEMNELSIQP